MNNREKTTYQDYMSRVNLVKNYILTHLNEDITIKTLSDVSAFSPFHLQRVLTAFLGESVGSFIQRARMERAARLLTYSSMKISDIAYEVGYYTPAALSKMFALFYGISPSDYRKLKTSEIMVTQKNAEEVSLSKRAKIVDIPDRTVLYVTLKGDYKQLDYSSCFALLWQQVKEQHLFNAGIEHIVYYYNDPCVTASEHLSCDVCLSIHKQAQSSMDVGVKVVKGGRYAVFTYVGEYCKLGEAYDKIYGSWFPQSGYQMGNHLSFEKYVNDPRRVAPDKCKTEIYIAVE